MHLAYVDVLAPQDDGLAVVEIKYVVGIFIPKVEHLGSVARSRTDISRFDRDRTESFKEGVCNVFHQPHRPGRTIVQD